MHVRFLPRCDEGEFHTLFQRLRKIFTVPGLGPARGLASGLAAQQITGFGLVRITVINIYIGLSFQVVSSQIKSESRPRIRAKAAELITPGS
jgi:hypothetical protein